MKNRVLIFDFDGTIADTFHAIVKISNQLANEFQFKTMTSSEAEQMKNNTVKETIAKLNIPLLKIPIIIAKAKSELLKGISEIDPVVGLKETLLQLKNLGIQLGILTSNSAQNVDGFLKNHELQIFDFIKTTSKIWSKDHHLLKIIEFYNLKAAEVLYVGDEVRDILAAHRSGIKVAAVTWGYNSSKTLSEHNPDYLLNHPKELLNLID
jgi:phosphoglycolate phosphatase